MKTEKEIDDVIAIIRCIHQQWYSGEFMKDPRAALKMHNHMGELFNFAEITETLSENNPDSPKPHVLEELMDNKPALRKYIKSCREKEPRDGQEEN